VIGPVPVSELHVQRRFRLTRSEDFERARRSGRSYASRIVVVVVRENGDDRVRIGVAAGRTVGNAVKRNRAKRLLRAAMQGLLSRLRMGWDVVLIARPPISSAGSDEVREVLTNLLGRAGLLANS